MNNSPKNIVPESVVPAFDSSLCSNPMRQLDALDELCDQAGQPPVANDQSSANEQDLVPVELVQESKLVQTAIWLGKECLNFGVVCIAYKMLFLPLFIPLAIMVTGERVASYWWASSLALYLPLLLYGLMYGIENQQQNGKPRLGVMFAMFAITGAVLKGFESSAMIAGLPWLLAAALCLAFGYWIGCFFSGEEKKADASNSTSSDLGTIAGVVLPLAFVVGIKYASVFAGGFAQASLHDDKVAPATLFADVEGDSWTFEEHRGKVILVEFWAPWCGPCRAAFPHLDELHERYRDRSDFAMVSVANPTDFEQASAFFDSREAEWELLFRPSTSEPDDFQPFFIPAAYIVDRDGKVVASHIRGDAIDDQLRRLLGD